MIPHDAYHPSFVPLLDQIPERGFLSPWAYIEHWIGDMSHMHLVGDGLDNDIAIGAMSLEGGANILAESVLKCKNERHQAPHDPGEAEKAYKSAVYQLLNGWFDRERIFQVWLRTMSQKWGGHMPAAAIIPTGAEVSRWQLMVPDHRGDPLFYDAGKHTIEAPTPQDMKAKYDADRGLWHVNKPWSPTRRMESLHSRGK
tara:strand:- start:345 stop:941 length:597 start_codon:yes stop_codon:yes gene_type:complete